MKSMNLYNWQSHNPQIEVPRPDVGDVAATLARGGSAVMLGGRGMGKSVFLRQLEANLERTPGLRVLLVSGPPMELSVQACLAKLAQVLGVPAEGALDSRALVDAYFARDDVPERLVLLFDEFDRYAESRGPVSSSPPGRAFFNDLEITRRNVSQLGAAAAGSIAVFTFRDSLGSSFLSRADRVLIRPFERSEIEALARPFADRGEPLSAEALDALYLASGGNPALVTYGLGSLWPMPSASERHATEAFVEFQSRNADFLLDFRLSFADPRLSEAPQKVWELVKTSGGEVSHAALRQACSTSNGSLRLEFNDVLDVLVAAGLVRLTGSKRANPVLVRPVASIVTLPTTSSPTTGIREQLRGDLEALLARLHASSADFFRPGRVRPGRSDLGHGKRLVPEAVFAAFLAMGFELLGWQVEREAQSVAGRTDIRLRRNGSREVAVVEVKIWGRRGYREVQRQVESYWSADTAAGAVVMLTDAELPDWTDVYRRQCLEREGLRVEALSDAAPPVRARWSATSRSRDEMTIEVEHFLLRLPRGR